MKKTLRQRIVCIPMALGMAATSLFAVGCSEKLEEKSYGEFYLLREAFEYGCLTQEDLKSIAYYQFGGNSQNEEIISDTFVPQEQGEIPKDIDWKIRATEACNHRNRKPESNVKAKDYYIKNYFGCYNGFYVVIVDFSSSTTLSPDEVLGFEYYEVYKVTFYYHFYYGYIRVWKENTR